jgi:dihydroxy-acid dehydratase
VEEGDEIELDIANRRLTLLVSETELSRRRQDWSAPSARVVEGYLARYAAGVSSASQGAVLG